jgi:hypothetical protein
MAHLTARHQKTGFHKTGLALLFTAAMSLGALGLAAPTHADNPDTWITVYFAPPDKHYVLVTGYFANTGQNTDTAYHQCESGETSPDPYGVACIEVINDKNTCGAIVAISGPDYNQQLPHGWNYALGPTRSSAEANAFKKLGRPGDVVMSACSKDGVPTPPTGAIIPHPGENSVQ